MKGGGEECNHGVVKGDRGYRKTLSIRSMCIKTWYNKPSKALTARTSSACTDTVIKREMYMARMSFIVTQGCERLEWMSSNQHVQIKLNPWSFAAALHTIKYSLNQIMPPYLDQGAVFVPCPRGHPIKRSTAERTFIPAILGTRTRQLHMHAPWWSLQMHAFAQGASTHNVCYVWSRNRSLPSSHH